jgi:hypothetical protein
VLKRQIFAMASFLMNGTEMISLSDANSLVNKLAFSEDGVARVDRQILDTRVLPLDRYLAMYGNAIATNESKFADEKYSTIIIHKMNARCTIPAYLTYREHVNKERQAGRIVPNDNKKKVYTYGRPYLAVGPLTGWDYAGQRYVMGANFYNYQMMTQLPQCAVDARKKILWTSVEDAFHSRLKRYLSFEGIMMIFWQLVNSDNRLMGEVRGILSLSDIDCAQYVISHLSNNGGQTFQPEIAFYCFSVGRNAPIMRFYLPSSEGYNVLKPSYINNAIYTDDDMIIVPRHTGFSEITAASGFIVPDTCCFIVYPRNTKGLHYIGSTGHATVNAILERNGFRQNALQQPLIQKDNGCQDTHYNVIHPVRYTFIGPNGDEFNPHVITGVEAHIIKACSRALDDFAWSGSATGFRKCNVVTHCRVLANITDYVAENPNVISGGSDVRKIVKVSMVMLMDATTLMYADPNDSVITDHYLRLSGFADVTKLGDDMYGLRNVSDGYNKMTDSKFVRYFRLLGDGYYTLMPAAGIMSRRTVAVTNAVTEMKDNLILESIARCEDIVDVNRPEWSLGEKGRVETALVDSEDEYPSEW